jgi:hypothetical protein
MFIALFVLHTLAALVWWPWLTTGAKAGACYLELLLGIAAVASRRRSRL